MDRTNTRRAAIGANAIVTVANMARIGDAAVTVIDGRVVVSAKTAGGPPTPRRWNREGWRPSDQRVAAGLGYRLATVDLMANGRRAGSAGPCAA